MATLFAHGEMVNMVQPGDRITVTGIYRAGKLSHLLLRLYIAEYFSFL